MGGNASIRVVCRANHPRIIDLTDERRADPLAAAPEMKEAPTGPRLLDLDATNFEGAAFRALKGIEFAPGTFGLNTEQSHFKLAFWTGQ